MPRVAQGCKIIVTILSPYHEILQQVHVDYQIQIKNSYCMTYCMVENMAN